jgi:predicted DNA-binding transcriptional regulator YafY
MLVTAARLLRLLSLLQARRFWSGAELCERVAVTDRTLRRDIDRLRSLGYPVHSTSGVAGGYQLGAGAALPPLQLDDDEALAVSIALGTAATSNVSGIDEAALRALVKLEQVLPSRLRRRSDALRATIFPMHRPGGDVSASLLSQLAGASRDHVELSFAYADREGKGSQRRVQPVGLVHANARWYLVAWDVDRADFRTFRVDRFGADPAAGARFAPRPPPEGGDLRKYVSRALSTAPYEARISVILNAPLEVMTRRVSPSAVQLEHVDAARCRLRAGASTLGGLVAWLLMLDVDFEVEDPPEVLEHVRAMRARLGRVLDASRQAATEAPPSTRARPPASKRALAAGRSKRRPGRKRS